MDVDCGPAIGESGVELGFGMQGVCASQQIRTRPGGSQNLINGGEKRQKSNSTKKMPKVREWLPPRRV